ncbi:MAG: disulfide bond formation protein B [Rhodospirillales bacterium]|nr:disulfide bond formation protein B [Rhodospirillales bacterium]
MSAFKLSTWIIHTMANPVAVNGGIFLISAITLMVALISQYVYGLQPCILCIYQRVPYALTALLGIGGLITLYKEEWGRHAALTVFLSSIIFFIGSVIAFYHSGVEQHWWVSILEGCKVDFDAGSVEELMQLMDNKPAARCDEIPWADPVFGLSMAAYNTMMSFGLGVGCAISAILIRRKDNGLL